MRVFNECARFGILVFLVLAGSTGSSVYADSDVTCYIDVESHPCVQAADAVPACTRALQENPFDFQTRLSLCAAHLKDEANADRYMDAYIVVNQGEEQCGSNQYVCQKYKVAKSMLLEEDSGGLPERSISAKERCDYGRELCLSRLSTGLGIRGCDQALICNPEDAVLYSKKGQKLLKQDRPTEAIVAYRNADRWNPSNAEILASLAEAEQARLSLVADCKKGISLDECNRALLPGEADEFDIQYQRGKSLLAEPNPEAALQAFVDAQNVDPTNKSLAIDLLELLRRLEGDDPRAFILVHARGRALLATGKTDDAILALKQAKRMEPTNDIVRAELTAARSIRQQDIADGCLTTNSIAACESMILPGEPDESKIRQHIARLTPPPKPLPVATAAKIAGVKKITAVEEESRLSEAPSREDRLYSNLALEDGRTY
jgi:tetratricopeptide (TPR) repeat protein